MLLKIRQCNASSIILKIHIWQQNIEYLIQLIDPPIDMTWNSITYNIHIFKYIYSCMGYNSVQLRMEVKKGHQVPWGYEVTVDMENHT